MTLLGAQILFAALGILGGFGGVIYAFKEAGRLNVATGFGYIALSITLMFGGGLLLVSLLLP
jgi:uncharacterized membrane protein YqjE